MITMILSVLTSSFFMRIPLKTEVFENDSQSGGLRKRIVWTAKTKVFENAGLICILFTFYTMLHQSKTCFCVLVWTGENDVKTLVWA